MKKNIFGIIAFFVIFTFFINNLYKISKDSNSISFKEIKVDNFLGAKNISDEECYREILKNDSITRPDSTKRDFVEPIRVFGKEIIGDTSNLPISFIDESVMGCIKNVGSRSIALHDINNDGYLDIFRAPNLVIFNEKNLKFTVEELNFLVEKKIKNTNNNEIPDFISRSGNPLFLDIDNDGKVELLVGTEGYNSEYLFRVYRYENKNWVDLSNELGYKLKNSTSTAVSTLSTIDYNNDGFFDILIGWSENTHLPEVHRRTGFINKGMMLLKNNKGKGFTDITKKTNISNEIDRLIKDNLHYGMRGKFYYPMVFTHQILAIDLDKNGWQDIIVAGDYGTGLLLKNFSGVFYADNNKMFRGESLMGIAIDDVNKDNIYDIFITQIKGNGLFTWLCEGGRLCNDNLEKGNKFFVSNKDGTYVDRAEEYNLLSGGWGWGAVFADFNNDGTKELLSAAGFRFGHSPEFLGWGYRDDSPVLWEFNKTNKKYENIIKNSGLDIKKATVSVSVGDLNNDGLLDIAITEQGVRLPRIFINNTKKFGNFININPIGTYDKYNKGFNADIEISYGDKNDKYTSSIKNYSHMSTGDNTVWFGVGEALELNIIIKYKDGEIRKYNNIKTNQSWRPN